jgi:hypothetical protein
VHIKSNVSHRRIYEDVHLYLSNKIAAFTDASKAPKTTLSPNSSAMKLHRTHFIPVFLLSCTR